MKNDNLIQWLTDPRTAAYFGDTFKLRADVLAAIITGGNLAAVARQHGVTRAATSKQGRRVRAIFGELETHS
ncbi:MAG TPA: hypothetical protein VMV89_08305 [Candidatus Paceibacterota bacterium]|nr:hypothetical protein [Candidatus Paceibacterota bacterium]